VIASFADITKRKLAEQRAIEWGIERKRSEMLAGFINDASHEFRTPLTLIQTSLYFLKKSDDRALREQKAGVIEDQVRAINHLVTMLGLQARLDSKSGAFSNKPVNMNSVIEALIETIENIAKSHQHRLSLTLPDEQPWVTGDVQYLAIALRQIIDNALRYTPNKGQIDLRLQTALNTIQVFIQDNGVGIPADVQHHIFTRFYRRDVAHTTPGFGLGLSIAARIIEDHGGTITLESEIGVGSTFIIHLPRLTNPA
jgi:signal transduction histidine kinase